MTSLRAWRALKKMVERQSDDFYSLLLSLALMAYHEADSSSRQSIYSHD